MRGMADKAELALIKAMGERPLRLVLGSVEVVGRSVSWDERCQTKGKCLHFRTASAPRDAIDQYFDALEGVAA